MGELRKQILVNQWIITGTQEPWEFLESLNPKENKQWKQCPFCPGNESLTSPEIFALRDPTLPPNSSKWEVRVVPEKKAVLKKEGELSRCGIGMHDMMNTIGTHELIIETPKHINNISEEEHLQIKKVFTVYQRRIKELGDDQRFRYPLIFKNQKEKSPYKMGHTYSQLIAFPITPKKIKDELINAKNYYEYKERCIFCDILQQEQNDEKRVILKNNHFIAFVPFASRFVFETWILPLEHQSDFALESEEKLLDLAEIFKKILTKIEKIIGNRPLSYALYTQPYLQHRKEEYWKTIHQDYHWHLEIYPLSNRLLGLEVSSGSYIEPILPEKAAQLLREV